MILTYTGRFINPFKLEPKDISIRDIAHALSMTCRWGGHTSRFYSVAEHSVRLVEYANESARWALLGSLDLQKYLLLHDASEAYLTDVPRPYKQRPAFEGYRLLEEELQRTIMTHFGCRPLLGYTSLVEEAKRLDTAILGNEAKELLPVERINIELPAPIIGDPDVSYRAWRGGLPGEQYAPGCIGMNVPKKTVDRGPWGWTPEVAEANFLDQYTRLFGDAERT